MKLNKKRLLYVSQPPKSSDIQRPQLDPPAPPLAMESPPTDVLLRSLPRPCLGSADLDNVRFGMLKLQFQAWVGTTVHHALQSLHMASIDHLMNGLSDKSEAKEKHPTAQRRNSGRMFWQPPQPKGEPFPFKKPPFSRK